MLQLLQTRAEDVLEHGTWIMNSPDKFTSTDIQNKHLSIMALSILRGIANNISGKWFTIMVDESTDLSLILNRWFFCLCYVDDNVDVQEEVIGFNIFVIDSLLPECRRVSCVCTFFTFNVHAIKLNDIFSCFRLQRLLSMVVRRVCNF